MAQRRVVITGLGTACPVGSTVDAVWSAVRVSEPASRVATAGELCALPRVREIDFTGLPVRRKEIGRMNRADALGVVAAAMAALDAGWSVGQLGKRAGLFLGTTKDTVSNDDFLQLIEPVANFGYTAGAGTMVENATQYLTPFALLDCMPNLSLHYVSDIFRLHGDNCCFLQTGAAGAAAVVAAYREVRSGRLTTALAGGFDSLLDRLNLARFASLGLISEDTGKAACRPFDRKRDGFLPGEAGVMLVLEDRDAAHARGATIHGEILGVGSACESEIGQNSHTGMAVAQALTKALGSARLKADEIGFIIAHGEGTFDGDRAECSGIRFALGHRSDRVPVTALKGIFGHVMAGAGPLDVTMALRAMESAEIPPVYGCDEPDENCALSLVRGRPLRMQGQNAAVISTGFGGHAYAMVLGRGG